MERCVFYALRLIDSDEVVSGVPLEDLVMRMPYPDNEPESSSSLKLLRQPLATRPPLNINLPVKNDIGRAWNGLVHQFGSHKAPPNLPFVPRVPVPLR